MKASEIMSSKPVYSCTESTPAREAAKMMLDHNVGAIPVENESRMCLGIVTDRDLCCRILASGGDPDTPVSEIMSTSPQCIDADANIREVESMMREHKIRRLPVCDKQQRVIGFISTSDLLHHCRGPQEEHELTGVLDEICSP